jgi:hypothetical protein
MPNERELRWHASREQWHTDEINAYAMEQELFRQIALCDGIRFKGEMVLLTAAMLKLVWRTAFLHTKRPPASDFAAVNSSTVKEPCALAGEQ